MDKKTNCTINGIAYYREYVTFSTGRRPIYGKSYTEFKRKRDEALRLDAQGLISDKSKLGDAFINWFENVYSKRDIQDGTILKYEQIYIHNIQGDTLCNMRLSAISQITIQKFLDRKATETRSINQMKETIHILRMFFDYTIKRRLRFENPCDDVCIPGIKNDTIPEEDEDMEIIVFSDEELTQVLNHFRGGRYEFLFTLLAGSGMRIGEALALTYGDFTDVIRVTKTIKKQRVKQGGSTITVGKPKTKESIRELPFKGKLKEAFQKHKAERQIEKLQHGEGRIHDTDPVFTAARGNNRLDSSVVRYHMGRACKTLCIPHRSPHAFRHTYITKLAQSGAVLPVIVKDLAGHSNIKTTMRYFHAEMDHKELSITVVDAFL